jgi:hypothetical protein
MTKEAEHKLIRVGRVAAGMTLLPVGVALLVLPGPGIPLVIGGLMLLEPEFPWAGRARTKLQDFAKDGATWLNRRRKPERE